MDAIEQAIRNAFAKGDPGDRTFRERVYRSASSAIEKAVQANPALGADELDRRRRALLATITRIETEFVRAAPVAPAASTAPAAPTPTAAPRPVPPAPAPTVAPVSAPAPRVDPQFGAAPAAPREPGPTFDLVADDRLDPAGDAAADAYAADEAEPARSRGRRQRGGSGRWGWLVGLLVFLIIGGLAVWTAAELGLLTQRQTTETADTGPAAPGTGPARPGESGALEDWITVFSTDDPTTVSALSGARAEVVGTGPQSVLRISGGSSGVAVRFDIGQGVLERIAGKRAVFDIVARGAEGVETQMSVSCELSGLQECGRNRYQVGTERAEYLFEVDVPAGAARSDGVLLVVADATGENRSLEIVEIRVTAGE